jgi:hypothetical protein
MENMTVPNTTHHHAPAHQGTTHHHHTPKRHVATRPNSRYHATKHRVIGRGVPPDSFLDELVAWGRTAADDIFVPNAHHDIYTNIVRVLGPWRDLRHRRAVMLEVMRVLAGFESSWRWNEGRDVTNPTSVTPTTIEAGAWQVSANSMGFGQELEDLVLANVGSLDGSDFQRAMKQNHQLAMEYIARLLRRTVRHNGPVKRHEIDASLSKEAVLEFLDLLYPSLSIHPPDYDCVPQYRGRLR